MKLKTLNGILLAIILGGFILFVTIATAFLLWIENSGTSSEVPAQSGNATLESTELDVDIEFHQWQNYHSKQGMAGPRIYLRQGENSGSKFSSFSSDAERNIGHIRLTDLQSVWYFPSNNQNILDIDDLFISDENADVWQGAFIEAVINDTNGDGLLSKKDNPTLYWLGSDYQLDMVSPSITSLKIAFIDQGRIFAIFSEEGQSVIGRFDADTKTFSGTNEIVIPK